MTYAYRSKCAFWTSLLAVLAVVFCVCPAVAQKANPLSSSAAPVRLLQPIDEHVLSTLKGNVRRDVARAPDLGPVEDSMPLNLFLVLQRTPAQQADLENLIARQQQPTAAEYHKWLTPAEFGARFGAAPEDIARLTEWLESQGFQVRGVLNNAGMIDFAGSAGQVREAFHTQLHHVSMRGGTYSALVQDPQIPAALAPVVAGIAGLNKIPALTNHTEPRQASRDQSTHRWHLVNPTSADMASPAYTLSDGFDYDVTPHDLYTIYNVNPVFTGGNLAVSASVAVVEESDIEYGTVNSTTGAATGGDVATFRTLFGVPGTLNMHVYHGYGSVACNDPGIDPSGIGEDVEASLDAEWINATAPSANLIFMSCDSNPHNGIWSSFAALIDNNLSDVMSLSYGESEEYFTSSSDYSLQDGLFAQAATQGQSILISSGDSGSDVKDQNTTGTATSGINVSAFGSPLVTVTGGTDFSDYYDANEGGSPQSNYWGSTNSAYYADALGYIPEMPWNDSCASSILAAYQGYAGAGYCATNSYTSGSVVGGSGGISTHYAVPSWQTGILSGSSTYSNSMHAQPDIAGFASAGFWGHGLIFCDSNPPDSASAGCTSSSNFGVAGGTSFVAPYMAGVFGLLRSATGSRQGVLNPALYALARAQYTATATKTACYANGQTSNTGVTTGLPAASCIFNDVTTGNNDVPCAAGSTSCYVNSGQPFGMLSLTGSGSLTVAYPSTVGFDQVTGLGSINVSDLISKWNTAFTSSTKLTANPTTITSGQSTQLTATVTGGTPTGYVDTPPALTGTITFKAGTTTVGNCTLSSGTCSASVAASALQSGSNSMTAIFSGSGTYPSSTSSPVTVTFAATPPALVSPVPKSTLTSTSSPTTFTWTPGNATLFQFNLGTAGPGANDVYYGGQTTSTSIQATIPQYGVTLYARLYYELGGSWSFIDYYFTEAGAVSLPQLTTPAPGTTLAGASANFQWNPGVGSSRFVLKVGTFGAGSGNVFNTGITTATSASVNNIPTTGGTLYVRLQYLLNGTWNNLDYTYTEYNLPPALVSPVPKSTLTSTSSPTTFTWTPGNATLFEFNVGTTGFGANDVYHGGQTKSTSVQVTVPQNGVTLYARLYYKLAGAWSYTDYYFTEAGTLSLPQLTTPTPGTTLSGASANFQWNPGVGATKFVLKVGTFGPGAGNVFNTGITTATSAPVNNIPTTGGTLYVRLQYLLNGAWNNLDYTYTEAP